MTDNEPTSATSSGPTSHAGSRPPWPIAAGAALGMLAVLAGAFGAHALKATLPASQLATWDTAAEYHLAHALALVLVGLLTMREAPSSWLRASALSLTAGVLLFSGSLYLWVLSSIRVFVFVTPVGGVLLVLGWAALCVWAFRRTG